MESGVTMICPVDGVEFKVVDERLKHTEEGRYCCRRCFEIAQIEKRFGMDAHKVWVQRKEKGMGL